MRRERGTSEKKAGELGAVKESRATATKILQTNLNRSRAAWDLAMQVTAERSIDVLVIGEPNKARAKAAGVYMDQRVDVAVLVAGGRGSDAIFRGDGVVGVRIGRLILVAGYASPNIDLRSFEEFLERMEIPVRQARGRCLVCGDFNAKSPQWGSSREDARGRMLADAFASWGVQVVNEGNVRTFVRRRRT